MQGLWKANIPKNFYNKDYKIKKNKFKHFKKDKGKFFLKNETKLDNSHIYIEDTKPYMKKVVILKIPVIKTRLYKKEDNQYTFLKEELVYFDSFSEERGFRRYSDNKLLVDYKKRFYNKIYVPVKKSSFLNSLIAEGDYTGYVIEKIVSLEFSVNKSSFLNKPIFIKGKPVNNSFFYKKTFNERKRFCKKIANKKSRSNLRKYLSDLNKDINFFYGNDPKTSWLEKSIAYCVS
jgi:hypothetical protein